jgi:hypothetical protein
LAVTGRQIAPGIPNWPREGWPLRLYGVVAVVFAGLLGWLVWRAGASWDGVVLGYFWASIALVTAIQRSRQQRS